MRLVKLSEHPTGQEFYVNPEWVKLISGSSNGGAMVVLQDGVHFVKESLSVTVALLTDTNILGDN